MWTTDDADGRMLLDTLRKHAHAIYKKIVKNEIFDMFLIFAQNIDCGRGGSNEYPQFMFWSKNKKNRYTPATPVLPYENGV